MIIVTEKFITDFYFWRPIIDAVFLPGCGQAIADTCLVWQSELLGSTLRYLTEIKGGGEAQIHYKTLFGDAESVNWVVYNTANSQPVTTREIVIKKRRCGSIKTITSRSDIKRAITLLFFEKSSRGGFEGVDQGDKRTCSTILV